MRNRMGSQCSVTRVGEICWYLSSTCRTHASQEVRLRSLTLREARKEKIRNRAFLAMAPCLWNSLPSEICMAPSLGIFKGQLKTWLFRQAFPPATS